jgi:hypothetical protein
MRRPLALVAVLLLVVFGFVIRQRYEARRARAERDAARAALSDAERAAILERRRALLVELEPVTLSNCRLARVGSRNDGGYVMCANLMEGVQTAYSYGIGGQDDWGCEISRTRKVPVHQYDCFEPPALTCRGGDFRPNAQCVGPRRETVDGREFDTLANQIARNGDSGRPMILKMDIEGAEWQSILAAPDSLFENIVQMPMELHGSDHPEVLEGLRKLKQHFHLVSVHYNNWSCSDEWAPVPAWAYQVLLVNKKVGVVGSPPPGSPTLADVQAPDNPGAKECGELR